MRTARATAGLRPTPAGLFLEIDIRQRLLAAVPNDEASGAFLDRPRRRKAVQEHLKKVKTGLAA